MHNLGVAYLKGEGLAQDDLKAYAWIHLAAQFSNGGWRTRDVHRQSTELKTRLGNRMTAKEIDKAERLSRKWRKKMSRR